MKRPVMRPTWKQFTGAYLDYTRHPDSAAVKRAIGGNVNAAYIKNTCAVRLSRGLNYSGVLVPAKFPGLTTVSGADKKRYALRVTEMRKWLTVVLGDPDFDQSKAVGSSFDKTRLRDYRGILAFDIAFSDASGHFDSFSGTAFSNEHMVPDYWTKASRISLWNLL